MSHLDLYEQFQLTNEKNILIQGLPSSIEKQFAKVSFSKNVTPLLRNKKIDFALVFAINHQQLCCILKDVFPALHGNSKVWIAYPKSSSKIVSDLNRVDCWEILSNNSYEKSTEEIVLDNVWGAVKFNKVQAEEPAESAPIATKTPRAKGFDKKLSIIPAELDALFVKHNKAKEFFSSLPSANQKEFVTWIEGAKRSDTKQKRLASTLEKLLAGKKNPIEK
ncbi:YdeI/OmpD-associated family protein [Arachidicoccus terrestris]|uniref:YdeI/OmpD-associated family protein n=1 Tax=Arachidicoccus terrestris TaxID=2875539 RepID=UPI001CC384CE|nr:YdeI/OmpD-associated family protein [Arachidicoccus terrestris]UAY56473.1 YdeI/OmpD-associated family protein [Arachidicoccus terrestris]